MLNRAEIKQNAKKVLMQNKWSFIVFFAICAVVLFFANLIPFLGQLAVLLINPVITFVTVKLCFAVIEGESGKDALSHPFSGFTPSFLGKQIGVGLFLGLISVVGITLSTIIIFASNGGVMSFVGVIAVIATIVIAIYLYYAYNFVAYVSYDQPNLKFFETLKASKEMTNGYKMSIWFLSLSFIGWSILASLVSGLGAILGPVGIIIASSFTWGLLSGYMALSNASYYYTITNKASKKPVVEAIPVESTVVE